MGNNDFATTGARAGNYRPPGSPIWAEGYPGFNYILP
jgi:hypothetical protein